MEVYLDILIIENIIMNYIILWVTAKFSRESTTYIRLLVSACVGAAYAALVFFPSLEVLYSIVFKILFSFVLVVIAFSPYKSYQFLRLLSIFYTVSFIFGGAAFGLFYFSDFGVVVSNGIFYISDFPVKILLISTVISYVVIKFVWTAIQNKLSKENLYIVIDIIFDDKKINLKALIDTANSLYDPISNFPVIVVEFDAVKNLLPTEVRDIFDKSKENDLSLVTNIVSNSDWISRFRLIPFSSLGKDNGMLIGFKPDEVFIDEIERKKELKNIIIGIYNKKLSKDESYSALLHPEIINI